MEVAPTAKDIWDEVLGSDAVDWARVPARLPGSEHSDLGIYLPDPRLALAWGETASEDYHESWANTHPDPRASSFFVDVVYNGVPIRRDIFVTVDGGRAHIPMPNIATSGAGEGGYSWILSQEMDRFGELFGLLAHGPDSPYTEYVGRAGLGIPGTREARLYEGPRERTDR